MKKGGKQQEQITVRENTSDYVEVLFFKFDLPSKIKEETILPFLKQKREIESALKNILYGYLMDKEAINYETDTATFSPEGDVLVYRKIPKSSQEEEQKEKTNTDG